MGMWALIFGSVIVAACLGIAYLTLCIGRFSAIKKLSGENKWRKRIISLGVTAAGFAVAALAISVVNAVMILLHVVIFFLIFGLLIRIINKVRGKEFKINYQGWLALITSVVYLSVGWYLCHNVWQTDYELTTDKNVGTLKIALIADSHLGTTFDGKGFEEHLKTIEKQSPDMLVIAGDFVDDSTRSQDLIDACNALGKLDLKYGVWYCYGNHDEGYYKNKDYTPQQLEKSLKDNGVHILADSYELVDDRFYVVGRKDKSRGERKDMDDLLKGVDTDKYIIVLDHEPNDYKAEADSPADLVLSGHTHGGQFFPVTHLGVLMSMNDKTYGYERRESTDFIVTSGISDWEIKFKTGTKSEYVIVNIKGD